MSENMSDLTNLRTLVRPMPKDHWSYEAGLYELCIDEMAGCGLHHSHNYGHDFPVTREELVALRDQIDAALVSEVKAR